MGISSRHYFEHMSYLYDIYYNQPINQPMEELENKETAFDEDFETGIDEQDIYLFRVTAMAEKFNISYQIKRPSKMVYIGTEYASSDSKGNMVLTKLGYTIFRTFYKVHTGAWFFQSLRHSLESLMNAYRYISVVKKEIKIKHNVDLGKFERDTAKKAIVKALGILSDEECEVNLSTFKIKEMYTIEFPTYKEIEIFYNPKLENDADNIYEHDFVIIGINELDEKHLLSHLTQHPFYNMQSIACEALLQDIHANINREIEKLRRYSINIDQVLKKKMNGEGVFEYYSL